jgi:hypothetical protein
MAVCAQRFTVIVMAASVAAVGSLCADARAQTGPRDNGVECAGLTDTECRARQQREEETSRAAQKADGGSGLIGAGAAIVPCVSSSSGGVVCGVTSNPPPVTRSPLTVRRFDFSAGLDHALSPQWAVGALVAFGRGRLHRFQIQTQPAVAGEPASQIDTTIHTRNTTLAGSLSWFPAADVALDASLAYQRSSFDLERQDQPDNRRFIGNNAGRG